MPAAVPRRPTTLGRDAIVNGLPVTGATFSRIASQYNHTLGMSTAIVPLYTPSVTIPAASSSLFRHFVHHRYQATHRAWVVYASTASGFADLTLTFPSTETATMRVGTGSVGAQVFYEEVATRTPPAAEQSLTIANDAASTGSAVIGVIGCFELARSELSAGTVGDDHGVNAETLGAGLPIFDGSASGTSAAALAFLGDASAGLTQARRTGLFHGSPAFSSASTSFANPFARGFVVRGRKRYRADVVAPMQVDAYVVTDVGTVGELLVTMTSGDTVTIAAPSGTTGWVSGSVDIDCDDWSDAYGRRSSRFDKATVEWRRVSGAGGCVLAFIGGSEAA